MATGNGAARDSRYSPASVYKSYATAIAADSPRRTGRCGQRLVALRWLRRGGDGNEPPTLFTGDDDAKRDASFAVALTSRMPRDQRERSRPRDGTRCDSSVPGALRDRAGGSVNAPYIASAAAPAWRQPCRCEAYAFPHRRLSGKCREGFDERREVFFDERRADFDAREARAINREMR